MNNHESPIGVYRVVGRNRPPEDHIYPLNTPEERSVYLDRLFAMKNRDAIMVPARICLPGEPRIKRFRTFEEADEDQLESMVRIAEFLKKGSLMSSGHAGTEKKPRPATGNDLVRLLESLAHHHVDYVLVGGQAINLNGYMRGTTDIDILLPTNAADGRKVIDVLSIFPDKAAKDVDPQWLTEPGTIRVVDAVVVDLMTLVANGETYESLKPYTIQQEIKGFPCYYLNIEGLILAKQSVRAKDRLDIQMLESMRDKV
jgi:hypothetical protein